MGIENDLARFDFGEIEDLIDERGEAFAGGANGLDIGALLRREIGRGKQSGAPHHAVERGADFVTHSGEEARLCRKTGLGTLARIFGLAQREG